MGHQISSFSTSSMKSCKCWVANRSFSPHLVKSVVVSTTSSLFPREIYVDRQSRHDRTICSARTSAPPVNFDIPSDFDAKWKLKVDRNACFVWNTSAWSSFLLTRLFVYFRPANLHFLSGCHAALRARNLVFHVKLTISLGDLFFILKHWKIWVFAVCSI